MNFILFGEIGAGKDTVAEILRKKTRGMIVKLGEKIHSQVDEYYPLLPEGTEKRKLFQDYGESMRDVFGQDIWNYVLHNQIKDGLDRGLRYIIADARQPKEYDYWRERGFIAIAIKTDETIRRERSLQRDGVDQGSRFEHYTEINARRIIQNIEETTPHLVIVNNDTLDTLRNNIDAMLHRLSVTS